MNYNKRRLFNSLLAAAAISGSIAGGCRDFRCGRLFSDAGQPAACIDASAARTIIAAKNMGDLQKRLPAFSSQLKAMAQRNDFHGMAELYEQMRPLMRDATYRTRMEQDLPLMDQLEFLGEMFLNAESRDEKMAIVFLALPRLHDRTIFLSEPEPGSLTFMGLSAEQSFMRMLENDPEFVYLHDVLLGTWYRSGGSLPNSSDRQTFFEEFSRLY